MLDVNNLFKQIDKHKSKFLTFWSVIEYFRSSVVIKLVKFRCKWLKTGSGRYIFNLNYVPSMNNNNMSN